MLDRETAASHTIVVKATSADGSSQTQSYDISIADVNEFGITAIADTNTGTNVVDENSAIGATVGITAFASDADGTDEITYSLSLNPGSQFAIDSATGVVTTNASLDSEAARSIVISVLATSTDGSTSSQDFNVIVRDLNDNAPRITVGQSFIVSEFANAGDTVGVVTATDADATASTISWSIVSGNGDGVFAINSATGQISIADSTNLDFELMPNYSLGISVSDGVNAATTASVAIAIGNENDAPTIGAISNVTINEDSVAGPIVFAIADVDNTSSQLMVTATSSNSDLIKTSNIRLGGGGSNRTIRLNPVGNAFGTSIITVTVSDGQTTTSTTFQLVVLPVNDAPVLRRSVSHVYNIADGGNLTVVSPGLLNGFSDVEGDAMSVVVVVAPKHGTVVVNADGAFTYVPIIGYSGDDSFQFEVTDGLANSSDSTVRIFVPTSVAGFNTAFNSNSTDSTSDSTSDRTTTTGNDVSTSSQTSEGDKNAGTDVLAAASAGLPSGVARGNTNDDDRSVFVMPESGDNSDDDAAIGFFAAKVSTNDNSEDIRTQLQISQADSNRVLSSGLKSDGQTTIDVGAMLGAVPVGSGLSMNVGMQYRYDNYAELKGTVEQLGSFEENLPTKYGITNMSATTVAAAGASVVFGSVVTALRTGMLALTFLGQLPMWTIFDPLMVMDGVNGPEDGDSLQDIVDGQNQDNVPEMHDAGHKHE